METVKNVLRLNKVPKKRIHTKNNNRRPLDDYKHLSAFREFQLDAKHILDEKSLPQEVYRHILQHTLPLYEWNMIDVATRGRFTAYAHRLDSTFGFSFITMVLLWLRGHNVQDPIRIRVDNGVEFCMGSVRNEEERNMIFALLNARVDPISPGPKYLQTLVENSHRKDDECFLSTHPLRCPDIPAFIAKVKRWQDTWNTSRPGFGIAMQGKHPYKNSKNTKE
jgi:putative transposase